MPNDIGCWRRLPFPLLADCLNLATARLTPPSTSTKCAVCVCAAAATLSPSPPSPYKLFQPVSTVPLSATSTQQSGLYCVCTCLSPGGCVESVRLSLYFVSAATEDRAIDLPVTVFPPAVNNNSPPPLGSFQSTKKNKNSSSSLPPISSVA